MVCGKVSSGAAESLGFINAIDKTKEEDRHGLASFN